MREHHIAASAVTRRGETWSGEPARLDRALAELGLVRSRSQAHEIIAAGGALVDGAVEKKAGAKVRAGAVLQVSGVDHYVSRGAHKLVAALDEFGLDPRISRATAEAPGQLALDVGASTGGFTQVLLERGAREVIALDVGHGQLADSIRADARVRVVEGCNARTLTRESLAGLSGTSEVPTLVVADLSFISLTLILPALARCTGPGADLALLIKPQFEVGRVKNGVVTDPSQWEWAIRQVIDAAAQHGFAVRGLAPSPIAGGEGNREFLVHFVSEEPGDPREWDSRVREVCLSGAPGSGQMSAEGSVA